MLGKLQPIARAAALALSLVAFGGCGGGGSVAPAPRTVLVRPMLFAVTAPESLVAGGMATLYAHRAGDCGDLSSYGIVNSTDPARVTVDLVVERRTDYQCPADNGPVDHPVLPFQVQLPASGPLRVVVRGSPDSIEVTLDPTLVPAGPEHVIETVLVGSAAPAAGVGGAYFPALDPRAPLASFVTDASGIARTVLPADSLAATTWLHLEGSDDEYLGAWIQFPGPLALAGSAFRTRMIFRPAPAIVARQRL